jgi:hypothetical protein
LLFLFFFVHGKSKKSDKILIFYGLLAFDRSFKRESREYRGGGCSDHDSGFEVGYYFSCLFSHDGIRDKEAMF